METISHPGMSAAERRRHPRYPLPLKVFTREQRAVNEKLCNISLGGLCFRSPHTLKESDYIYIHLSTTESEAAQRVEFAVVGKVCRVEELSAGYFEYGVEHRFYDDPFSDQMKRKLVRVLDTRTS